MNLLTIGTEYTGSLQLYGCGIKSANLFENIMKEKFTEKLENIISLRGNECTCDKIMDSIKLLIENKKKTVIFYCGHGNRCNINSHFIEYWDTISGPIDQIKMAKMLNNIPEDNIVILFSESCSSEHMINPIVMKKRYLYVGATQDYESAIITCDGGLFSMALVETLNEIDIECNIEEFISKLMETKIDAEHFSVQMSDVNILNEKLL